MTYFPNKIATERDSDTALIDERGASTWSEFNERTNRLVNGFRDLGLNAGDVIAIYAGNCREYYEVMMAATHAGLVYVPVNWHFSPEELAYLSDWISGKVEVEKEKIVADIIPEGDDRFGVEQLLAERGARGLFGRGRGFCFDIVRPGMRSWECQQGQRYEEEGGEPAQERLPVPTAGVAQ